MKRTRFISLLLLMTALGICFAQSNQNKKGDVPPPSNGKNGDRSDRPQMELTTLTGKLTYTGKPDKAATLLDADGKRTVLKVMGANDRNGEQDKRGKNGASNGNNARPPLPADTNGQLIGMRGNGQPPTDTRDKNGNPPKPVTLDDLKKLDGKTVEVKGVMEKDGKLLVMEIAKK